MSKETFHDLIKGCIYGGLVGDCYGYVYEDSAIASIETIQSLIDKSLSKSSTEILIYTDDTQMALAALRSLRTKNAYDAKDIALNFANDFFNDGGHRYYGGSIKDNFHKFITDQVSDIYSHASKMFNNTGSYGNGGAMRAAPLAIYAFKKNSKDFEKLIVDVTRLTHANPLAIFGALAIAHGIRYCMKKKLANETFTSDQFLDHCLDMLKESTYGENLYPDRDWKGALKRFEDVFNVIKGFLKRNNVDVKEVRKTIKCDLEAIHSVPVSIYSFLLTMKKQSYIKYESPILQCLVYAISLGDDTDSNACMACALSGAYFGLNGYANIPKELLDRCERLPMIDEYVEWLIKVNSE